jgi:signal transduction histidine kinase
LNRAAQKRAFEIFHFALRPEGKLFLGTSESADDSSHLFQPLDKKHRIYGTRLTARTSLPVPSGIGTLARALALQDSDAGASLARRPLSTGSPLSMPPLRTTVPDRISWSELHLRLIEQLSPPSLVVNGESDILHLSETATPFLRFAGGEPSTNLFRAINPMLRVELRATLFRAKQTGGASISNAVPVVIADEPRLVDIRVSPALSLAPDLYLVTLDLRPETAQSELTVQPQEEPVVKHLERELEHVKRHWRDIVEQHEASTEELKASNEELQAMNEELRSATEELETSREELQSINEELTTVNQELKSNVDELGHANSDLRNLMGSTAIATIFLDRDLHIMRFTPPAVDIFRLIPTDVGRPLAHLRHQLVYPELLADAARVLEQLVPIEREVPENGGRFFLARLLPYRTNEDRIAGVVLTFVDVTELQQAQEEVRHAQQQLEQRVNERTAELDAVNAALRTEISNHQRAQKSRRDLQTRLLNAQEEERSRISRELHDEVGQQITALMLAMKSLESAAPGEETPVRLRELRATTERVGREIHHLAQELRPVALDQLGLSRALSGYLDAWAERSGINVDFVSAGVDEPRLPSALETTLYRIVQEAMNNIYKHAAARSVSVSIERHGDTVLGVVEDDGAGFEAEVIQGRDPMHLGIAGMNERAATVGGSFTIESSAGGGTTVRILLPVPSA